MCNLLSRRTNSTFFDALSNFDLVYFLLFLPTFTHLFTALWQKKTTLSRVVFLLACGMGEEKPGASCRQASRFHLVGAACWTRPLAASSGFRIPVPQPRKKPFAKANGFFQWNSFLRNEWNTLARVKLPAAVKYAYGVWGNEFYFTLRPTGAIFHNSRSELFHIRRKANISLEKLTVLWYNNGRKAVNCHN